MLRSVRADTSTERALPGVGVPPRLLTAAEVAEQLGCSEHCVWRLGREGVLPASSCGSRLRPVWTARPRFAG